MIDEATGEEKVVQWYIKWEATDEISGPMTKAEALEHTGDGSGMAFSEGVFEPYHLPADVTEMVNVLLSASSDADRSGGFAELSGSEARDLANKLVLLARPMEVTALIKGGVFKVETIAQGVSLEVRNYDSVAHNDEEIVYLDSDGPYTLLEFGGSP